MKIIITENQLKNLINRNDIIESKQVGILYHTTTIENLFKIIQENKLTAFSNDLNNLVNFRTLRDRNFMLTPWGPIVADREKYKPTISFTRNKSYKRTPTDSILVIDGDKLSNKYRITPYSNFGGRKYDEMEERIYSDVVNLDKYIVKVILPYENEEMESLLKMKGITYEIDDRKKYDK